MKSFACILLIAFFGLAASQFVELQPSQYENDQTILESLNFGGSHIIKNAVEKDVLPDGQYEITLVSKVEEQVTQNGTEYRFNLEIAGPRSAHIVGNVTVSVDGTDGSKLVVDYFYSYYFDLIQNEEAEVGEVGETGEAGESALENGETSEEAEFSWEWYNFESENGEGNVTNEEWNIDSNILPVA